jgi:hypothetical protein
MTVRAPNFAFAQLAFQPNRAAATSDQPSNVMYLVCDVVKLKNQRIRFVAIGASGIT